MPMTAETRRAAAVLWAAALGLTAGAAAYAVSFHMTAPRTVPITLEGCLGHGVETIEIPLESLRAGTSAVPISFGPIDLARADGPIRLHFRPAASPPGNGGQGDVVRSGDMVELPLTFGHDRTLPDRIDLKCLDGELTAVRYRHKSASQTFRVVNDPGRTDE